LKAIKEYAAAHDTKIVYFYAKRVERNEGIVEPAGMV
jgi:hypothetical protein